jgi:hypothetical protein
MQPSTFLTNGNAGPNAVIDLLRDVGTPILVDHGKSLTGAEATTDWRGTELVAATFFACIVWALRSGRALNALMLGEHATAALGFDSERLIFWLILLNTIYRSRRRWAGVMSFVGLVDATHPAHPAFVRLYVSAAGVSAAGRDPEADVAECNAPLSVGSRTSSLRRSTDGDPTQPDSVTKMFARIVSRAKI